MTSNASGPVDPELIKDVGRLLSLIESGQRIITMAGPAGCGKTERIAKLIAAYGRRVCTVAFMGQAVRMLQRRGISATTIHGLIYTPRGKNHNEIASTITSIGREIRTNGNPASLYEKLKRLQGKRDADPTSSAAWHAGMMRGDEHRSI